MGIFSIKGGNDAFKRVINATNGWSMINVHAWLHVASCSWQRVSWITAALLLLTSISADPPASPQVCGFFIIWLYFLKLPFAMSTHCCSALLTLLPTLFFFEHRIQFLKYGIARILQHTAIRFQISLIRSSLLRSLSRRKRECMNMWF